MSDPPGPVGLARTLLFVPGNRPERFAKAAATAADVVIVDLEDAVPEEAKAAARGATTDWLGSGGARAAVRVNGAQTRHHDQDVDAVAGLPGTQAVVLPRAEDPEVLAKLHERLGPTVEIVALVETARGLLAATELAAVPGVARLAFGHLDFASDIGSSVEDDAMLMARSALVVASRAAGLPGPVDGITTALDDAAAAARDAVRAISLGFTGKLCVHPLQVDVVNDAFAPNADELRWARGVLAAAGAGGAVRVDGHMVDRPLVLRAQAVIARAKEQS